jgi:hypothetical protein
MVLYLFSTLQSRDALFVVESREGLLDTFAAHGEGIRFFGSEMAQDDQQTVVVPGLQRLFVGFY